MPALSSNNRKLLLELARKSIQTHLATGDAFQFVSSDPELNLRRGCFITLRKHGRLRGCIGTFDASQPVYLNVIRMAAAAAFQDMRFPPVSKEEFGEIRLEISVLGEPEKVESIDQIELGTHGVLVKHGFRSGTFLPDVATEFRMSLEEFVMRCAREKAGLDPEECAQAEIYRYEVEKFSETV